ncbi:hypothetical protein [Bacillus phage YungSlug]|nr:hypothetical protein [Bacillus phage YungSlug]
MYTKEDVKAVLTYWASNKAMPFPNLSKAERDKFVKDILDDYETLKEISEKEEEAEWQKKHTKLL